MGDVQISSIMHTGSYTVYVTTLDGFRALVGDANAMVMPFDNGGVPWQSHSATVDIGGTMVCVIHLAAAEAE